MGHATRTMCISCAMHQPIILGVPPRTWCQEKEVWPQTPLEACPAKTSCGFIETAVIECDMSTTNHLGQRWQSHVGCVTVHGTRH